MSNFSRDFWNNLALAHANGEFTYSNSTEARATTSNSYVLRKIEDAIVDLLKDIRHLDQPSFEFGSRSNWGNVQYIAGVGLQMKKDCGVTRVSLCKSGSSTKFGLILKVLSMIYGLLQANQTATKRDLYYSDPKLFKTQVTLDHLIDDIGCALDIPRHMLNVVATSKGCVVGDLQFASVEGEVIDCSDSTSGVMVPTQVHAIANLISKSSKFILVVEKDATFQRLLSENLPSNLRCVMITGKGIPDVNTRLLTRMLSDKLRIPVFGLFDADPYGIEIMCVYRFGSLSLAYDSANLAVPNMRWIGLLPTDLARLAIPQAMLPFTERDAQKCRDLARRPYMAMHAEILNQVKVMENLKFKAELQSLGHISPSYLGDVYLPSKIKNGEWI